MFFVPSIRGVITAIIVPILIVIAGCRQNVENKNSRVFRYNAASGISSLDPAYARDQANIWGVNQIYNGLVQFDTALQIHPSVAKRWQISDDGLTYTFFLRDDVYFHDHELFENGKGRRLTAEDVAYSLSRIIDPKVASPGAWIFNDKVDKQQPFSAIDDTTFQIRLRKAFRPLLSILTMQYTYIVPKEMVAHYGKDFRVHPVGTGPFKFKIWKEGNVLILVKNENYFEMDGDNQLPYPDGVKVTFVESKQTEYLKFMKGDLDLLSGIDASYINDLLTKDGTLKQTHSDKIKLYKTAYLNSEYLGFLMDDSMTDHPDNPLSILEIRQAINYGFDREQIIKYLRNNIGKPATAGFVPFGLPSFDQTQVKGFHYDPELAKELLIKAGYPNGDGLSEIPLYTNTTYEDIATYIQKQLAEIGINIKLEIVPPAFQRELMSKSKAEFFRGSWIADYPDAESYLAMFYGMHQAPPNYTRFNDVVFDSLYESALNENNDERRYALYQHLDRIIVAQAAVVPLYYDEILRFVRKDIDGLEPNPMNLLDIKRVRMK